jgi:hypothetical protein
LKACNCRNVNEKEVTWQKEEECAGPEGTAPRAMARGRTLKGKNIKNGGIFPAVFIF